MGIFDNYKTLQNVLDAGNEASNRNIILDSGQFYYHSATGVTDLDALKILAGSYIQAKEYRNDNGDWVFVLDEASMPPEHGMRGNFTLLSAGGWGGKLTAEDIVGTTSIKLGATDVSLDGHAHSISDLTDHNKAAHDALNIDADTLDGVDHSDISLEIDTDIATHTALAEAHHSEPDHWEMNLNGHTGGASGGSGLATVSLATNQWANFGIAIPRTGTVDIKVVVATSGVGNAAVSVATAYNLGTPNYSHGGGWDATSSSNMNLSSTNYYYVVTRHSSVSVIKGQYLSVRVQNTEASYTLYLAGVFIQYQ